MGFGLEIIGLAAAGTFAVSLGIAARLCGRSAVSASNATPNKKTALHVAVARERARAKRCMVPEKIALQVVEYLRAEGLNAYPLIPEDLDEAINLWCDDAGVERVSTQTVKELIALLPGVSRPRPRLNMTKPEHRYVRRRQIVRIQNSDHPNDRPNDRPVIYVISDVRQTIRPDKAVRPVATDGEGNKSGRTVTSQRPSSVRTVRTSDRTHDQDDHQAWPSDDQPGWSDVQRREAA